MESNTYTVDGQEFELQHYGVKGMKWGVRKAREEYRKLDKAKGEYKHAKKAYNRSFKYAYNRSGKVFSLNRATRVENNERWRDANRDARRLQKTKNAYKKQKQEVRKNAPIAAKLERGAKAVGRGLAVVGGMYVADQVYFGGAGTKAAKAAVSKAYNALADKAFQYSILDASGNILRRYN